MTREEIIESNVAAVRAFLQKRPIERSMDCYYWIDDVNPTWDFTFSTYRPKPPPPTPRTIWALFDDQGKLLLAKLEFIGEGITMPIEFKEVMKGDK